MPDLESLNDALVECVKACGGSKQVGARLWPEKSPDAAQRLLLDCLNTDRPAHLTPEQMMLVLRLARERGCHAGMRYIATDLGYSAPVPVDPKDELAELLRATLESNREQQRRAERIERLMQPSLRVAEKAAA